jgi:hypothetical protein
MQKANQLPKDKDKAIWMMDKRVLSLAKAAASDIGMSVAEFAEMVLRQYLSKLPPIEFKELLKDEVASEH